MPPMDHEVDSAAPRDGETARPGLTAHAAAGAADKSGRIQSVQRALHILDVIAAAGGEATLTDISRDTGLKVSTCHHLLATLIEATGAAQSLAADLAGSTLPGNTAAMAQHPAN
jgi:hypothetical protein